jgi:site-specific DNA-cytosine methylase
MLDALPHLADYELRENVNKNIRQRSIDEPIRTLTHKLPGQVHLAIRGYSRTRPVLDRRGNHTGENVPHGDDDCNRPLDGLCWTVGAQPLLLLRANSGANAAARPRSLGGQSHALTSGGGLGPSLGTQPGLKFKRVRQLTPEEGLALMGFLPDFDLSAATTQRDKWQGIGNAVCPPVAAAIINGRLSELETLDGWL